MARAITSREEPAGATTTQRIGLAAKVWAHSPGATTAEAATPKHKRLLREADTRCFMEKPLQWVKKI
jgi:hypothetical protein